MSDSHPAFPSQQLFTASDGPAYQAGHAGEQGGSHRQGPSSPQPFAMLPEHALQSSSAVPLRQREDVSTAPEAEGVPSLFGGGDRAEQFEAMAGCSRNVGAVGVPAKACAEASGLDVDAFLPPSLSPRQAINTALHTRSSHRSCSRALQYGSCGFARRMLCPFWLMEPMSFGCRQAGL